MTATITGLFIVLFIMVIGSTHDMMSYEEDDITDILDAIWPE